MSTSTSPSKPFDYQAHAERTNRLWAKLQVNEIIFGPIPEPPEWQKYRYKQAMMRYWKNRAGHDEFLSHFNQSARRMAERYDTQIEIDSTIRGKNIYQIIIDAIKD